MNPNAQQFKVAYGSQVIVCGLLRSSRKRVCVEVHPDQSVLVRAPNKTAQCALEEIVCRKAWWIRKQRQHFEKYLPRTPDRKYVSGEAHLYLGRKYRLKIHAKCAQEGAKLTGGYIHVYVKSEARTGVVRQQLWEWYLARAGAYIPLRVRYWLSHNTFRNVPIPQVVLRPMQKRWGSCSPHNRILLNPDLIRAPRSCIDYVIVHELCHLHIRDHSPKFFRLLANLLPDWKEIKRRLEATTA